VRKRSEETLRISPQKCIGDLRALERGERPGKSRTKVLLAAMSIVAVAVAGVWFWLTIRKQNVGLHLQSTVRTERLAPSSSGDHAQKSPATFADLEPRKIQPADHESGYEPVESAVDLSAKRSFDPPAFRLLRSKGALEIQSEPPGAQFSSEVKTVRFRARGTTPQSIVDLPTGKYLVVAHRGDWEMRSEVEVTRGEIAHKVLAFVSATTNITSEPSRAEIFVDGKSRGRTPLRLELPVRSHELTAQLDGGLTNSKKSTWIHNGENPFIFFCQRR